MKGNKMDTSNLVSEAQHERFENINSRRVLNRINDAKNNAVKHEIMALSMLELNTLVAKYLEMADKYELTVDYESIGGMAIEELKFREASLHREIVKDAINNEVNA
jgi:hypothetical protein